MSYTPYTYTTTESDLEVKRYANEYMKKYWARVNTMKEWCDKNFRSNYWGCERNRYGYHEFWFVSEKDLTLFLLRWA